MLAANLLARKRDGFELSDEEIRFLVSGFCDGSVADYQMSALAMAICLRGMSHRETATLTQCMLQSGQRLPREPSGDTPRVDKHSTGGLGDKVSLILAPLLACCGVHVPMVSGRGLGISGGTLDKLEAIDGFRTDLSTEEGSRVLREVGAFIVSASETLAPADRKLYALRDVTGTVESVPLITASILSKKLSANLDALVMDVKVGSAAFMKTIDQATALTKSLCSGWLPSRFADDRADHRYGSAARSWDWQRDRSQRGFGNPLRRPFPRFIAGNGTRTDHSTLPMCIGLRRYRRRSSNSAKPIESRIGSGRGDATL